MTQKNTLTGLSLRGVLFLACCLFPWEAKADHPSDYECAIDGTFVSATTNGTALIQASLWSEEQWNAAKNEPFGGWLTCTTKNVQSKFPALSADVKQGVFEVPLCAGTARPLKKGDRINGLLKHKAPFCVKLMPEKPPFFTGSPAS